MVKAFFVFLYIRWRGHEHMDLVVCSIEHWILVLTPFMRQNIYAEKCKAHSLILRERDARLSCSSRVYEWSSLVCKYRWFCKCTEPTKISFSRQRLVIIRLGRLDSKELSPATSSSWCEMKLSNMHSNNWIIRGNCRQSSCLLLLHYPPYERKITGNNMEYYTKATASPP